MGSNPKQDQTAKRLKKKQALLNWQRKNKEHLREYRKQYREKNREKIKEYHRKYWRTKINPETKARSIKRARKWMLENPEYHKEYYQKNKEYYHAKTIKRRATIFSRLHPDADLKKIAEIYKQRAEISKKAQAPYAVDHIIPISLGGYHHQDNMQIMPEPLNKSKAANPTWEMRGYKSWRDVPEFLWPSGLFEKYKTLKTSK